MSTEGASTHSEHLKAITSGMTQQEAVAEGLGYPNHFEGESPNPTGWLNSPSEVRTVSRETTPSADSELRGSN